VGVKMAIVDVVKIHPAVSLAVVLGILAAGAIASIVRVRRGPAAASAVLAAGAAAEGVPAAPADPGRA